MTEEEARQTWCPFVREPRVTRQSELCEASACMAWRWFGVAEGETFIDAIKRHRSENSSTLLTAKSYVEAHPEYIRRPVPDRGYCGLAGKP
jgi:hypothetical protein